MMKYIKPPLACEDKHYKQIIENTINIPTEEDLAYKLLKNIVIESLYDTQADQNTDTAIKIYFQRNNLAIKW